MIEKEIYIAPFLEETEDEDDNTIRIYGTPFKMSVCINSLNGSNEITIYGDRVSRMVKATPDIEWFSKIKEGDLAYLYGPTPVEEKVNGEYANYKVVAVLPQNLKMTVYFEKLQGGN